MEYIAFTGLNFRPARRYLYLFAILSLFGTGLFGEPLGLISRDADLTSVDHTLQARLTLGTASNSFATSVTIDGDTCIVASTLGFYVYTRTGAVWTETGVLVPSDGMTAVAFPYSVAIRGNTVAVGAVNATINGQSGQGAIYIFVRSGSTWSEQQRLIASDGSSGDRLGRSVAISGDTVIGGAYADNINGNAFQGSAYIFVRNGMTWTEQAKLTASDGTSNRGFGIKTAIDGDYAVIGGGTGTGADYVFVRSGSNWTEQVKICEVPDTQCPGLTPAIKGDTIALGSSGLQVNGVTFAGGVYIYKRIGTTWSQQQLLVAGDSQMDDGFGSFIGLDQNAIVIAAPAGNVRPGSAYLFSFDGMNWAFQQKFGVPGASASNLFGNSIGISGNTIIVGAPRDNQIPKSPIGAAYVYSSGVSATRSSPFDFDGDLKADIVVRRPSDNIWYLLRTTAGYTAMQFGVAGDLAAPVDYDGDGKTDPAVFRPSTGTWFIAGSTAGFYTVGWGQAGDLPVPADYDGDGKADIAVYRPSDGKWYRKLSNGDVISIVLFGTGEDKPQIGDYDGDGRADLAVRRPSDNNWYFLRTTAGFTAFSWGAAGDIAAPADFDGDGKTDVAVFRASSGVWFIAGSSAGFSTRNWGTQGDIPVAADYDGDGKADVAVFRPSNNTWYLMESTAGITQYQFGAAADVPIPSVFAY